MSNYSKQREIILGVIKELKTHPTAEELYIAVTKKDNKISKSTVYRNINILLESGQIKKISNPVGPDRYDYVSIPHNHVICEKCGKICHGSAEADKHARATGHVNFVQAAKTQK